MLLSRENGILVAICFKVLISSALLSAGNNICFEYFSQEDGLSNNQVHCSFQDKRGFMWFGSSQGVSRFDGYRFTRFVNDPSDSSTLRGNIVRVIFENSKNELYIGTENGGINLFNRDREIFTHPFDRFPGMNLENISVNDILEDDQANLWIGTSEGLLFLKEGIYPVWILPSEEENKRRFANNFIRVMTFDSFGNLWLGTNKGVFVLDTLMKHVRPFELPLSPSMNEEVWEMITDPAGKIWIGTYDNGVFIVDRTQSIERHFIPEPENIRSRTVRSIALDKKGNYWIGTRGGLFIYSTQKGILSSYKHDEREAKSLSGNSVLDIFHDARGDVWIGTRTGINYLVNSNQVFRSYRAMPEDNKYLNSSEVWTFWIDHGGKIWIGTEDGGVNILDPFTQTFSYQVHKAGDSGSLSSNCVKSFMDDGKGNLWIATYRGGINILHLKTGKITRLMNRKGDETTISDDRVWWLFRDSKNRIWAATSSGLDYYDESEERFRRSEIMPPGIQVNWVNEDNAGNLWIGALDELIVHNPGTRFTKKFAERTRAFLLDSKNRVWIATLNKGLALYSAENGAIRYFSENEGIANNQTLSILEDNNLFLWIGTTDGLSRFNPETGFFKTFTGTDGLQNSQFNYGAALKSPSGELIFGGISGFNIFDPQEVGGTEFIAPMVLTDLRIFNKRVEIDGGKKQILNKSITETEKIALPFAHKVITIEYAALNYVNSQNNQYSYFLEGFDKNWTDPSAMRSATYTNLDPGEYTFWVKSVVPGIPDAGNDISLGIKILPPFWKTWYFKMLIFLVLSSLIFALVMFIQNREKLRNELAFEKLKANKLHELDMLKIRFFTNISHEIRTPLTLILAPLDKLRKNQVPADQIQPHLDMMYRNASHLNQLINQILDFRKLEAGSLKLDLAGGDLVNFLREITARFENLAREKEIDFHFHSLVNKIVCKFDPDKIEKIINNLLSNAFKFTDRGGMISVHLSLVFERSEVVPEKNDLGNRFVEITVKDTGRGIPSFYLEKIFLRFFQAAEKSDLPGTGIGLALVKELVKLHEGNIYVNSTPGKGSLFTIHFPFVEADTKEENEETGEIEKSSATESPASGQDDKNAGYHEKILLIVEDNPDLRQFVRHHFDARYHVVEAADGQEGWEAALKLVPDIILCDVLMPRSDGYELLKRVKNDERTSHIPVILLTALTSREYEMEGLSAGADDYIAKPFDVALLEAKIDNILSIRQTLKGKYSGEIFLQPQNILISPQDEHFIRRAIETVENHIADPELDIEKFASEIGVSRMQLYRKLSAITDMTVKEFIRDIRLKRAAQLLNQKNRNVSEIAYAVGFRDLSHFRKCFRQKFGMSATEYPGGVHPKEDDQ